MNSNYAKGRLQAPVRNHANGIVRHRQLFFFLLLLVFGMASNITTALATTSANLTTINVGNVGPTKVFAGAQNVAILSFTVQVNPAGVSETFRDALVQFSGDSTADIASVQLYRESGAVPGTFNPASDTLLASATSPVSGEYDLDPANFTLAMCSVAQFYVVVNLNPGAVDGHKIDFKVLADKITLKSGTWPPSSEITAGTWDPPGFSTFTVPSLSINDVAVTEGNSGTVNATFSVALSEASTQPVTVNFATANGMATAPADYSTQSGTLTFSAGQTNKQITVLVNGDTTDEIDERFTVTLSNSTNASIATAVGTASIIDDDGPGISINNVTVTEGNRGTVNATFSVSLPAASPTTVTLNYSTSKATATAGNEYLAVPTSTITFTPGETTSTITVQVNVDTTDEADETFFINLSNPANATIADSQGLGTIINDDLPPAVSFNTASSGGLENVTPANLAVSLSAPSGKTVSVDYAVTGGTATVGVDYTLPGGTLTFAPGVTSKNISIAVVNDALDENDETIEITLSNPSNATVDPISTHTYTILDNDDPPAVSFALASSSGAESATPASLVVSLSAISAKPVTVDYAVSGGTASNGLDYTLAGGTLTFPPGTTTQNIDINIVDDTLNEDNEDILGAVTDPNNATLGTTATHTYTITDNDAQPTGTLSLDGSPMAEADGVSTVTATLSAVSGQTVTVNLAFSGTAEATNDYTNSGTSIVIPAGNTTGSITLTAVDDTLNEAVETIIVDISSVTNGLASSPHQVTATITDDDDEPTLSFNAESSSGSESITAVSVPVSLSTASGQTVTVNYSVAAGSTATSGADYSLAGGTLTFAPGVTTQNINVTAANGT